MSKKLTDWFPADVKPVRKGVYELDWDDGDGRCFALFDGQLWSHFVVWQWGDDVPTTCARAEDNAGHHGTFKDAPTWWRGLAEEPK